MCRAPTCAHAHTTHIDHTYRHTHTHTHSHTHHTHTLSLSLSSRCKFGDLICPVLGNFNAGEENSLLILDNASQHHVGQVDAHGNFVTMVQALAEARGAKVLFLSPYSPHFNPIEKFFANIKQQARADSLQFHTDTLEERLMRYCLEISERTARKTFRASGMWRGLPSEADDDAGSSAMMLAAAAFYTQMQAEHAELLKV